MGQGIGIAALVLAIIVIIVPGYGLHLSGVAIVLAVIAALAGDRVFATATPIIAGISIFFLSPLLWTVIEKAGQEGVGVEGFYLLIIVFLIAPFVAMFLNSTGKFVIGPKSST